MRWRMRLIATRVSERDPAAAGVAGDFAGAAAAGGDAAFGAGAGDAGDAAAGALAAGAAAAAGLEVAGADGAAATGAGFAGAADPAAGFDPGAMLPSTAPISTTSSAAICRRVVREVSHRHNECKATRNATPGARILTDVGQLVY